MTTSFPVDHGATPLGSSPDDAPSPRQIRKIAAAAVLGTALEWYDFFLFGTTAAIVFAPLFFPGGNPVLSTISAFLSFGVGFLARPVGAAVFGHLGDKYGRRGALVGSVLLMGTASALIGVLPTYAAAGIFAPILLTLLRAAQGVATGGEWGGATLLAMEYAPTRRRGFFAALVQLGSPLGTLLSSGAVALVALLPHEQFMTWGWRVPFLASVILVGVALWLRWNIEETPEFRRLAATDSTEKAPVVEIFRAQWRRLLVGICAYLFGNAGFFILSTFMISYVTRVLGLPASTILTAMTIGAVAQMVALVIGGTMADRLGVGRTVIIGYVLTVLVAFPIFGLVDTKNFAAIVVAMCLAYGVGSIAYAPIGALLAGLFPSRLHYSGLALSANLAGVIAGFMPAAATLVLSASDNASWGPALLVAIIGTISLVGAILAARIIRADAH